MKTNLRTRYIYAIFDIEGILSYNDIGLLENEAMDSIPAESTSVVMNLAKVPHIDSSALGALLKIAKKLMEKGLGFYLMNVNDQIKNVLRITGTYGAFRIVRDEETLIKMQSRRELDEFLGSD